MELGKIIDWSLMIATLPLSQDGTANRVLGALISRMQKLEAASVSPEVQRDSLISQIRQTLCLDRLGEDDRQEPGVVRNRPASQNHARQE